MVVPDELKYPGEFCAVYNTVISVYMRYLLLPTFVGQITIHTVNLIVSCTFCIIVLNEDEKLVVFVVT